MSSYSSPHTPNEQESDVDFSLYSLSSELDLDFACRGTTKPQILDECTANKNAIEIREPESLLVLTAKAIAQHFPFEVVESSPITVPEELQRLIAFHSFPTDEDDIWLYSCLSSGESYEFDQGEALWADKAVCECVQIGFHLSATVLTGLHIAPPPNSYQNGRSSDLLDGTLTTGSATDPYQVNFNVNHSSDARRAQADAGLQQAHGPDHSSNRGGLNIEPGYPAHRVSLTFDRGRITSCSCTCTFDVEERYGNLISPRCTVDGTDTRNGYSNNTLSVPPTHSTNQNTMFGTYPYHAMSFTSSVTNGQTSGSHLAESGETNTSTVGVQSGSYFRPAQTSLRTTNGLGRYTLNKHQAPSNASALRWGMESHAITTRQRNYRSNRDLMVSAANGFNVGITAPPGTWCSHVVATCLMRIRQPDRVLLRAPISESLSKLSKEDLQKFAQNLICYVGPKKILPAAQCILDQLLDSADNPMKSSSGAPDPTAGGALGDAAAWCFDGAVLEEKLRVTLRRFWASKPALLYTDIGSFNSHFPTSVENFHCVLNSLRSNIPRGLWDLLSIIGDMMRRQDNNGVLLLEIVTRCILDMQEVMSWWYLVQVDPCFVPKSVPLCQKHIRYSALWLCEEIVQLWRLACLNPELRPLSGVSMSGRFPSGSSVTSIGSRDLSGSLGSTWLLHQFTRRLRAFHVFALERAGIQVVNPVLHDSSGVPNAFENAGETSSPRSRDDYCRFQGFKPALTACLLTWSYELPPTHTLSSADFRACIPPFVGARLGPCTDDTLRSYLHCGVPGDRHHSDSVSKKLSDAWSKFQTLRVDDHDPVDYLFTELPIPHDTLELAFAQFQGLNAHGHVEQALVWARYLACCLLHFSTELLHQAETVAFEVLSDLPPSTPSSGIESTTEGSANSTSGNRPVAGISAVDRNATASRRVKKSHVNGTAAVGTSAVFDGTTTVSGSDSGALSRSKKLSDAPDSSSDQEAQPSACTTSKAVEWATKISHLLDQIRCLMECLTRAYDLSLASPTHVSSASRITNSGRALLMFRGPDPTSVDLHLDDTATPVAHQSVHHDSTPIWDEWICIDIELAFRLGFLGLSLPRPPTLSPTIEVRLFDQEVGLLTRMCRLPLHRACPHVILNIRQEAMRLAHMLSIYQRDVLVPYNLALYVFHQLVGTHRTPHVVASLTDPEALLTVRPSTETRDSMRSDTVEGTGPLVGEPAPDNRPTSSAENARGHTSCCPVLATGAILDGSGLPLVVSNYLRNERELDSDDLELNKNRASSHRHRNRRLGGSQSSYVRQMNLAQLEDAVLGDADLGFSAVLSVIAVRTRVPEACYTYFVESQWAQLNAIAVYILRHYRDDLVKLDRILLHLLDRCYNPNFHAPPLWACFTLSPRDLMHYGLPDSDGSNDQVVPKSEAVAAVNQNTIAVPSESLSSESLITPDSRVSGISVTQAHGSFEPVLISSQTASSRNLISPTNIHPDSVGYRNVPHQHDADPTVILSAHTASSVVSPLQLSLNAELNTDIVTKHTNNETDEQSSSVTAPAHIQRGGDTKSQNVEPDGHNPSADAASPSHTPPCISSDPHIFDPASTNEDTDTLSDSKKWTEAFRCATLRNPKRFGYHSVGMAAVDTSAPETTSSDTSPPTTRRVPVVQSSLARRANEELPVSDADRPARTPNTSPGLSASGSLFAARNGLPVLRSRNRAFGPNVSSLLPAHGSVSSYSSTSISEDDDHVPSRIDPPNARSQLPLPLSEIPTAETDVTDNITSGVANGLQLASNIIFDKATNQRSNDDEGICGADYGQDKGSNNTGSFPLVAERCSLLETALKGEAEYFTNLNTTNQHSESFERLPPQPLSNSIAFHMFNLAKMVRKLAGGPRTSGSVFMAEPDANGTVDRNLHLVAFHIGLFGLGLCNALLPSWQSRTFSRDSGWISQQVFEIGIPAACVLYHSWREHLTAAELAGIAFQLSRENNRALVDVAAELCLASLSMCTTLKPLEIYRAISQCEEHSSLTLERGLLRIESSENQTPYGILPEIHFFLARSWFSLHQSVMEEYRKALDTLQLELWRQQIPAEQQPCNSNLDPDSTQSSVEAQAANPSVSCSSARLSMSCDVPISGSVVQTVVSGAWPNHGAIPLPSFPQISSIPPRQQTPTLSLTRDQSVMYPPSQSPSIPRPLPPTSLPVYPSMFYYAQPNLGINQTRVYGEYGAALPSQPALLPTPVYAPTGTFGQISCVQPSVTYPFHHPGSSVRGSMNPVLPVAQHPTMIHSNLTAAPAGPLGPNSQMIGPTLNQVPIGAFGPPIACVTTPQTSQPIVPAINMIFQLQREHLAESALHAANLSGLVTSQAPVSSSINPVPYVEHTLVNGGMQASNTPSSPNGGGFSGSPPVSAALTPVCPPVAAQLTLTQRLASMSNASSSVVVHPASSDRGSSASETDSSRPADSLVEGGPLEEQSSTVTSSNNQTPASNSNTPQNSKSRISLSQNMDTVSSSPPTTSVALKALETKSQQYLRRSYLCATNAIKKIFLSHSTNPASVDNPTTSHTSYGRGIRAHKAHHHYHHHHHHYPHSSTVGQSRRNHEPCSSNGASGNNVVSESFPHSLSSACHTSSVSNEVCRMKRILDVPMESQVAKAWNANILWTLDVASVLGPSVVHEYCNLILQCVQCPLLMNEIAIKVIDYFKRFGSNNALRVAQISDGVFVDTGTAVASHSKQTRLPSIYFTGNDASSLQYYPTIVSQYPNYPIPSTDAWSNPTSCTDSLPPFPSQNTYMTPAEPCQVRPPTHWGSLFVPTAPCQFAGNSLKGLIARYQQLAFPPSEQISCGPGTIPTPCVLAQSQNCITPSAPIHQPQQVEQQRDPLSFPYHSLQPGTPQWLHQCASQPPSIYPPASLIDQSSTVSASVTSAIGGQELIGRFVNRTHALFHKFIEHRLQYIGQGQTEWDEFVDLILKAYNVHLNMPATDYGLHWNNLLTRIRRHHKCSSSLWQRILAGIQTADLKRSG